MPDPPGRIVYNGAPDTGRGHINVSLHILNGGSDVAFCLPDSKSCLQSMVQNAGAHEGHQDNAEKPKLNGRRKLRFLRPPGQAPVLPDIQDEGTENQTNTHGQDHFPCIQLYKVKGLAQVLTVAHENQLHVHNFGHNSNKRTIKPVRSPPRKEQMSQQRGNQTSQHTSQTAGQPREIHKAIIVSISASQESGQNSRRTAEKEAGHQGCRIPYMHVHQIAAAAPGRTNGGDGSGKPKAKSNDQLLQSI